MAAAQFRIKRTDEGYVFLLEDESGEWRLHSVTFATRDEAVAAVEWTRTHAGYDAHIEKGLTPTGDNVFWVGKATDEPVAMSPRFKSGTVLEKRISWMKANLAGATLAEAEGE